ncbi:hypothetical protein AALP_AA1G110900 [Arabis alpina]|uniref:Protein ENHANCED DISEASE RESISTANCE 2 C-terminal domain-containing protein n=1 Tax=Arabis alpina TaxID=50452 RepID=A0A087HMH8_ARAAL|nr:hypothetical protein AALP_AA1G110900 [Arabis alpina]
MPLSAKDTHIRPAALCNVYYKSIAKLIAKRLHPLLDELISDNQYAFVPIRLNSDNAIKYCSEAVIADMSKVYDILDKVIRASGALCEYFSLLFHWIIPPETDNGFSGSFCPIEKKMLDCWSIIDPNSFRVRGKTYFRELMWCMMVTHHERILKLSVLELEQFHDGWPSSIVRVRPKHGERSRGDCKVSKHAFRVSRTNALTVRKVSACEPKMGIGEKKKEFAPSNATYIPFGVDVFLSEHKINHIAQYVKLLVNTTSAKLPSMLFFAYFLEFLVIVSLGLRLEHIPLYPTAIFQGESDGERMNIKTFRLIDDEVKKVRGFPMDTTTPFRDPLKILGHVANVDDLHISAPKKKLMHAYNEKPVLSRPQHEFYLRLISICSFGYISWKGFETFIDRLKICVLDVGLTIQWNKPEELPEQIMCCFRLNGIDFMNYHQLTQEVH